MAIFFRINTGLVTRTIYYSGINSIQNGWKMLEIDLESIERKMK